MATRWIKPLATMTVTSKFDPARLHPVAGSVMPHQELALTEALAGGQSRRGRG